MYETTTPKIVATRNELSTPEKLIWIVFSIFFGVVPMVVYFAWIERNLDFRRVFPDYLEPSLSDYVPNFPWVFFQSWSLQSQLLWNFFLVTAWGSVHSIFSQTSVYNSMAESFAPPVLRTLYIMITGGCSWVVMVILSLFLF